MSSLTHRSSILDKLLNRSRTSDDGSPEPERVNHYSGPQDLPPVQLMGYKPNTKHKLMNEELSSNIRDLIPTRLRLFSQWHLVYSSEHDGYSLNTLYSKCSLQNQLNEFRRQKKREQGYGDSVINRMISSSGVAKENNRPMGYVMVIRDSNNNRFGCYLNEYLRPMDHKRYYGNGECFLWKQERVKHRLDEAPTEPESESQLDTPDIEAQIELQPSSQTAPDSQLSSTPQKRPYRVSHRFKAFMYTGINDNLIYSNHDFIAVGSSKGQNGLYIDSNLMEGVSYRCETFGNEVLNGPGDLGDHHEKVGDFGVVGKFKILGIEIWRVGTLE